MRAIGRYLVAALLGLALLTSYASAKGTNSTDVIIQLRLAGDVAALPLIRSCLAKKLSQMPDVKGSRRDSCKSIGLPASSARSSAASILARVARAVRLSSNVYIDGKNESTWRASSSAETRFVGGAPVRVQNRNTRRSFAVRQHATVHLREKPASRRGRAESRETRTLRWRKTNPNSR